jgi:hypothetical protein
MQVNHLSMDRDETTGFVKGIIIILLFEVVVGPLYVSILDLCVLYPFDPLKVVNTNAEFL